MFDVPILRVNLFHKNHKSQTLRNFDQIAIYFRQVNSFYLIFIHDIHYAQIGNEVKLKASFVKTLCIEKVLLN